MVKTVAYARRIRKLKGSVLFEVIRITFKYQLTHLHILVSHSTYVTFIDIYLQMNSIIIITSP